MGLMLLFKEIADFRRFARTGRPIVFYAEHEGYFPYFEGMINELVTGHGQSLSYVTSDPTDPVLKAPPKGVNAFYLNQLLPFFMGLLKSQVFVMTLTDLDQMHLKRSVNPVHYVYAFHALVSTHMMYRPGAFDKYDSILCCGQHHNNEIRKSEQLNSLPAKQLVNAGYYRLERIYNTFCNNGHVKPGKTVLIAPSWGDKNVLETCGPELVEALLAAGYEVIVRPHPETVRRNTQLIDSLRNKFGRRPGFVLETSVATDDSLLRADVLICDCSGIALEYAFGTERPVLFMDVPLKIKNGSYNDLGIEPLELTLRSQIGKLVSPDDPGAVPGLVADLIAKRDDYKDRIIKLRQSAVHAFGESSKIGADHIVSLLKEKGANRS